MIWLIDPLNEIANVVSTSPINALFQIIRLKQLTRRFIQQETRSVMGQQVTEKVLSPGRSKHTPSWLFHRARYPIAIIS